MIDFFHLVTAFWSAVLGKLSEVKFTMYGIDVNLLAVLVAFFIVGLVITVFWKGARA